MKESQKDSGAYRCPCGVFLNHFILERFKYLLFPRACQFAAGIAFKAAPLQLNSSHADASAEAQIAEAGEADGRAPV
jgi:hypothetical protein